MFGYLFFIWSRRSDVCLDLSRCTCVRANTHNACGACALVFRITGAQVTLTQTAEIFRLNEMVIRMDAELRDVRNKLHHREMGVEEALIRSCLLHCPLSSSRAVLRLLHSNTRGQTTDGTQRTARIRSASLSYSSPTARWPAFGCPYLEVVLYWLSSLFEGVRPGVSPSPYPVCVERMPSRLSFSAMCTGCASAGVTFLEDSEAA